MNNLFAFHGIDHKVGVTMISQSVAELIALKNKGLNVLFVSLNGRRNCEFVREEIKTIDYFKLQMDSKMIVEKDFMRDCRHKDNLYMLAGIANEQDERYYFPETVKYLMEAVGSSFEIIIADTGSSVDNGLAFGGLCVAAKNYLIITQQESNVRRYEEKIQLFNSVEMGFENILVNKYYDEDPYNLNYIAERLELNREQLFKLQAANYDRQAEIEHKTLMEFKTDKFIEDITIISNEVLNIAGLPEIKVQRRSKWKNFI